MRTVTLDIRRRRALKWLAAWEGHRGGRSVSLHEVLGSSPERGLVVLAASVPHLRPPPAPCAARGRPPGKLCRGISTRFSDETGLALDSVATSLALYSAQEAVRAILDRLLLVAPEIELLTEALPEGFDERKTFDKISKVIAEMQMGCITAAREGV